MPGKRKDTKKRVLKTGEGQRKDGRYYYRYTQRGDRKTVYANTLEELRKKEDQITRDLEAGRNYVEGKITVFQLLEQSEKNNKKIAPTTRKNYRYTRSVVAKYDLANVPIIRVTRSMCRDFVRQLEEHGYAYSTIALFKRVISACFIIAVDDEILRSNPFSFRLSNYLDAEQNDVKALSDTQVLGVLDIVKNHKFFARWYYVIILMLETGIRISECFALTLRDIDFKRNLLRIDHQIQRVKGEIYICKPKSKAGRREIPLTNRAKFALEELIKQRNAIMTDLEIPEYELDGYTGFLILNSKGVIPGRNSMEYATRRVCEIYNAQPEAEIIEKLTPHVLRHTASTNMIAAGVKIPTVQYIMGHADSSTTLDVYTDVKKETLQNEIVLFETSSNFWQYIDSKATTNHTAKKSMPHAFDFDTTC